MTYREWLRERFTPKPDPLTEAKRDFVTRAEANGHAMSDFHYYWFYTPRGYPKLAGPSAICKRCGYRAGVHHDLVSSSGWHLESCDPKAAAEGRRLF